MMLDDSFSEFNTIYKTNGIKTENKHLQNVLNKFSFHFQNDIQYDDKILLTANESKIIIIDEYQESGRNKYIFLCFDYQLIIINENEEVLLNFFSRHQNSEKYFLRSNFNKDQIFIEEIEKFSRSFCIKNKKLQSFWKLIVKSLAGFLIKKSYKKHKMKFYSNSYLNFSETEEKKYTIDSFIMLRELGKGSLASVELVYYIQNEELFSLKIPYNESPESIELIERERQNFLKFSYPFIVKYFGYIEYGKTKCLLLDFIEGKTLDCYDFSKLNTDEKYDIIFEMILTIQYIHSFNYIYRDLHFRNVIINGRKDAIFIDFDRVIDIDEQKTLEFIQIQLPEIESEKKLGFASDVCSLGVMIFFILFGKKLCSNYQQNNKDLIYDLTEFAALKPNEKVFFENCFKVSPKKRPSINNFILQFLIYFLVNINSHSSKKQILMNLLEFNLLKINFYEQFYLLGDIYYKGLYVSRDINKSIHCYTIAADHNDKYAQVYLGFAYFDDKYVSHDINKSIHYLTLAANQNDQTAQGFLGFIYSKGEYSSRDIGKAIYYTLAANQNDSIAQNELGHIYYNGKYVSQDINKAFHYLSLAANQNNANAQCLLGLIYYEGKYVSQDINKAIHYFSLAANQNNIDAQCLLGLIYYEGKYVSQEIDKAIYYFSLAANQNNIDAQYELGSIYYEGKNGIRDINKAIHYFSLAANQNDSMSQNKLGSIYYEGKDVKQDINKAIHYFLLASKLFNCTKFTWWYLL